MNDPIKYYVMLGEDRKGPFTLTQLQAMWRAGSLTTETQYWFEGQSEWMPLGTIIELLEASSVTPARYAISVPMFSKPVKTKRGISARVFIGCGALLVLVLVVLVIGVVFSDDPQFSSQSYRKLNSKASYFDVIRALGKPDKEIEERDVPLPNVVLGYVKEKCIVYIMYSDRSFDKTKSRYLGIINIQGNVIHAADEESRTILVALASGLRDEVK